MATLELVTGAPGTAGTAMREGGSTQPDAFSFSSSSKLTLMKFSSLSSMASSRISRMSATGSISNVTLDVVVVLTVVVL